MKTSIKTLFLLPVLIAFLGPIMAGQATAQTLTTLHSFTGIDGAYPFAPVFLAGNTLYGTAANGGTSGNGTVFKVNIDGTGFATLHTFTESLGNIYGYVQPVTNSDGAFPRGVIVSGNTLYGTASDGGTSTHGTVFKVNADGTDFTAAHTFTAYFGNSNAFTNSDGSGADNLIVSGNILYGTAAGGGGSGGGTVFALNSDGTGFVILHTFTGIGTDGDGPYGALILSGSTLYGTTLGGGSSGNGTLFALNTDGTGFATLYNFTPTSGFFSNSDGSGPWGLIVSGNTLYGTAGRGGDSGNGTVFKVNTDGTSFRVLHRFTALSQISSGTNSDGALPNGGLVLSGNTLYGTSYFGGSPGNGTVFALNTDGTGFTNLHTFAATPYFTNSAGARPLAGLILLGNTLYGTTAGGGTSGNGTVFSITLPPPQLTIFPSATGFVLAWPTNVTGSTLQSTTNLSSSAVWTTNSTLPVVINGQNTVTNPVSGTQQFFRLSQ